MSFSQRSRTLFRTLPILLALASPAYAGGVERITVGDIPAASHAIRLGGSLDDWPTAQPVQYAPLNPWTMPGDSSGMRVLRKTDHSTTLRLCYDQAALYVAVDWHGLVPATPASQSSPGDSVTLSILGGRIVHVRFTPGSARAEARIGDSGPWSATLVTAVSTPDPRHLGYAEQIRIPWRAIDGAAQPPADSHVQIVLDSTWRDIGPSLLKTLPLPLVHTYDYVPECVLTSPDQEYSLAGYLPNTGRWGHMQFVDHAPDNHSDRTPVQQGATTMQVERVDTPPMLNGSLASWPAGAFIHADYLPGFIDDRYAARIGALYDDKYLYVAMHARSEGPMYNVEPENTQQGFWGGDCLQVRMNDGVRNVNLCGWYSTLERKPALTSDGKDLPNPFLLAQGAREVFHADTDGKGYVQELAIPWSALAKNGAAPAVGGTWPATFQIWFAGLGPHFSAYAVAGLQPADVLHYSYTLPQDSHVTVGLYDNNGRLLRWLLRDEPRHKGLDTETWNGLDQYGAPLPAGKYILKGIYHQPIGAKYVMSLGNPGTPPWPTADDHGDWIGDESTPQGVATDGKWVFLASPCAEKGFNVIALDSKGQRQWGVALPPDPRCVSLSVTGNDLYILFSGPELTDTGGFYTGNNAIGRALLVCLDKRTGNPAGLSQGKLLNEIATWPYREDVHFLWDLRNNHAYSPATYGGQPRYFCYDVGESTDALGVASTPKRVYVSLFYDDKILVLDSATAQQIDTISVPKPAGLRALPDGTLLVVSGASVVHIDPKTKSIQPLIGHGLSAPFNVTTDSAGNIYVSDWGSSMQVKVYRPDGAFIRAIGKEGGRPWIGAWQAGGMSVPRGIGVTGTGKLWVAEDDSVAKRVSVWNAHTGALIRDYLGPTAYGGGGPVWFDTSAGPKKPITVYNMGMLLRVDLAHRTWQPVSIPLRKASKDQPFEPVAGDGIPGGRIFTHGGHLYEAVTSNGRVEILERRGDLYQPVAALGSVFNERGNDGAWLNTWDSDIRHHFYKNYFPDSFLGKAGYNFTWTDTNGDGLAQPEEIHWQATAGNGSPPSQWESYWGGGIGPDGSVYFAGEKPGRQLIYRLDIQGWTPAGAPIYDPATAKLIVDTAPLGIQALYVGDDNRIYAADNVEWPPAGAKDGFDCFDRNGRFLWGSAGPKNQGPKDPEGNAVIGEYHSPTLGNVIETWAWHDNVLPYLVTSDGLYVTSLLDPNNLLGPYAAWGESYKDYFTGPDGTPYIVNGANDALHILAITGLNTGGRFSGKLVLTSRDVAAAAKARMLTAAAVPAAAPKPPLNVAWLSHPPTIDGTISGFDMSKAVSFEGSNGRGARVALGRDATNLYLAYQIHGAHLVNKGANWQTLFITGDCCDLMLATQNTADHARPAAGDERLLLSVYEGRPVAVLYRPVVPGTAQPVHLMAAEIDKIVQLGSAHIACHRADDFYTLEASVPLADLGIDPATMKPLRGDVGVIFADSTGANRALRLYYFNQDTAMVNDLTTEATLQPSQWGPIDFSR